jgi:ABC-type Fe3+/spermidine/putrescine transport system ATPase subunit
MSPSPEAPLVLDSVTQRFGRVTALERVSLSLLDGEFVTLLGPSGCGKSTLLRIIAGFQRPSEGRVLLDGRDITRVPAHKRPVNMVFQRPTLFPHLTVADNVAYGLRIAGVSRPERGRRVEEMLALVRLEGYGPRRSHELSGGQMQRVALARALVNRPRVLLLDEPLSALDLKIRLEMEVELRRLHRETGATFIYVTHDQGEALSLSDRIVLFDQGRVIQVGAPEDVYRKPATPFTASFVGDANVLPVEVCSANGSGAAVTLKGCDVAVPVAQKVEVGPAWLVLRPQVIRLSPGGGREGAFSGVVRDVAFRGSDYSYRVDVPGLPDPVKVEIPAETGPMVNVGTPVELSWEPDSSYVLAGAAGGADG